MQDEESGSNVSPKIWLHFELKRLREEAKLLRKTLMMADECLGD